jgi:hypothetical protein
MRTRCEAAVWPTVVIVLLCEGGCYSWQLGVSAADAGSKPDAAKDAAAIDMGTTPPPGHDAGTTKDATLPDVTAPSCATLAQTVASTRAAAIACTSTSGACSNSVSDACGCVLFVGESPSAATSDYLAAVMALQSSGCPLGCSACPAPAPTYALCLAAGMGTGLGTACTAP